VSTLPPEPFADPSAATPGAAAPGAGRTVVHAMRQPAAAALLLGNAIFLFLGVSDLLFTIDGWFSQFDNRSAYTFGTFVGLESIALPLIAVLLATYVQPVLPQARTVLAVALAEYAVSAFFGAITYLGAFVSALPLVRPTFDGMVGRAVWFGFLALAALMVFRIFRALYPPVPKANISYGPTVYGRPYPGQPSYPTRPTPAGPPPAGPPPAGFGPAAPQPGGSPVDVPTAEMPAPGYPAATPAAATPPVAFPEPTVRMPAPAAPAEPPAAASAAAPAPTATGPAAPSDATRVMPTLPTPAPPAE